MSLAQEIGNNIRAKIISSVGSVFTSLGVEVNEDKIVNDCARYNPNGLEASFYIQGLDNVVRKDFNAQVAVVKASNPLIEEFKVKFKRPEKEVRFFLKVRNESN